MPGSYINYDDVPWYRRATVVNVFVIAGFFGMPLLLWAACLICLSGDVYTREVDADGLLVKCPESTKIAALCAVGMQSLLVVVALWRYG
jgi:hypothetical protein